MKKYFFLQVFSVMLIASSPSFNFLSAQCNSVRAVDAAAGYPLIPVKDVNISVSGCAVGTDNTNSSGYAYFSSCRSGTTSIQVRAHHFSEGWYTNSGIFYWYNVTSWTGCLNSNQSVYQFMPDIYSAGQKMSQSITSDLCAPAATKFSVNNFNHAYLSSTDNQRLIDNYSMRVTIMPGGVLGSAVKTYHDFTGSPGGQTDINFSSLGVPMVDGSYYLVRILLYKRGDAAISSKILDKKDFEFGFRYYNSIPQPVVSHNTVISNSNYSGGLSVGAGLPPTNVNFTTTLNIINIDWSSPAPANIDKWGYDVWEVNCSSGAKIGEVCAYSTTTPWGPTSENLNFACPSIGYFNSPSLAGKCFRTTFWGENKCGREESYRYFKVNSVSLKDDDEINMRESMFDSDRPELKISPSPLKSILNISIQSTENQNSDLEIFDINGRRILSKQVSLVKGQNSEIIDMENFLSGLYLIRVKMKNTGISLTKKVNKI